MWPSSVPARYLEQKINQSNQYILQVQLLTYSVEEQTMFFFSSKSYSVHKNINYKRPTLKIPIACFQANFYK